MRYTDLPMPRHLLLLSTSTVHGTGYLEHAAAEFKDFLGSARRVLFIPYALKDHDAYAAKARAAFEAMGYDLDSIHESASPRQAIERAEALFCGGGNTFRLLDALYRHGSPGSDPPARVGGAALLGRERRQQRGLSHDQDHERHADRGAALARRRSASSRFQINPHYVDPEAGSKHMGETREERLLQFHEENEAPVVGLREGALLRVTDASVTLKGLAGARIFRKQQPPVEVAPGTALESWLG